MKGRKELGLEDTEELRRSVAKRQAHLLGGSEEAQRLLKVDSRTNKQKKLSALLRAKRTTPEWIEKLNAAIRGVPKSEETRRLLSQAARKRFETDEARRMWSLSRGGVMAKAFPLMIRGASNDEVMEITGMTRKSAIKVRKRLVKSDRIPKHSPEETRQALSDTHSKRDLPDSSSVTMANRLLEAGLISDDPIYWNRLEAIELRTGIQLYPQFADRLRLEVFTVSLGKLITDPRDFKRYQNCGLGIDPQWFRITQIKDRALLNKLSQTTAS